MAARIGTRRFQSVTTHNKKDGKKEAADVALRTLIAEGQYTTALETPSVSKLRILKSKSMISPCKWTAIGLKALEK